MVTRQRGMTLPELLSAMCVVAIVLAAAVPSFAAMFTRLRVQGASAEFGTDLQYARSEAIRQHLPVSMDTNAAGDGYAITVNGEALKTVTLPPGVTVTASTSVAYDAMRALAQPADQAFVFAASDDSVQLRVSSNVMGRAQLCVLAGSVPGYSAC
ncbi:MAG TPA: GspH/FimT family pseudopilin [Ideonella sp.]|uniref:GspH/FimT family pseudopilin n=1 Tax=Ideonella sp. TaxID=1929293 RepID=UPI002E336CD5|nr:GspH/FimT family pseudopilin [Ideonella sp.]HEX5683800.1 GspH/FimT family pseudopilin [Ideonella sp.]